MEIQPPEIDIKVNGGTNNLTSVPSELLNQKVLEEPISSDKISLKQIICLDVNTDYKRMENEPGKNKNLGEEILKKSVSWAEEEVLVETREIEKRHRENFSMKILKRLCCVSKSGKESDLELTQS